MAPLVKGCCCCLTLREGAQIAAWYTLICGGISAMFSGWTYSAGGSLHDPQQDGGEKITQAQMQLLLANAIISTLMVLAATSLIKGVRELDRSYMTPWLVVMMAWIVDRAVENFWLASIYKGQGILLVRFSIGIIWLLYDCYVLVAVVSFIQECISEERHFGERNTLVVPPNLLSKYQRYGNSPTPIEESSRD